MLPIFLLFTACIPHGVFADLHSSIPEDLYAFPKYRVSFLNALPIDNNTAESWLRNGLQGGEAQFLGQWRPGSLDSLESVSSSDATSAVSPSADHEMTRLPSPALEHMRLGPQKSYLCLIPPAPTLPPHTADESSAAVTPSHSWSLLQPLAGTCLYHHQGWFTYSYCHNLHVRQFRELPTTYPHPPGARVVEEDPEWESYTLGRSSSSHSVGGELTVNDEVALANNLELARQGAGQRYLVQRWSDGTMCDKTGRPREIEVQFHCSMTMTDTVLFVKETRTCEYVLVIHTPRLCGEPGFKSRLEQMPETAMRCREVVDNVHNVDKTLPEAPHPFRRVPRQPVPAPPASPASDKPADEADTPSEKQKDTLDRAQDTAKLLRRALESLLGRGAGDEDDVLFELQPGEEDGEYFISLDVDDLEDAVEQPIAKGKGKGKGKGKTLAEALRAAGYDVKGQKGNVDEEKAKKKSKKREQESRDEL